MNTNNFSAEQLAEWISHAENSDIRRLIENESDKTKLESIGRALNLGQALDLIAHYPQWDEAQKAKLMPILVGMPSWTFITVLRKGTPAQIDVLKHESLSEPVQHHLMLLYHEAYKQAEALEKAIAQLEGEISFMDLAEIGLADRKLLENRIREVAQMDEDIEISIDKGLGIAWNAGRTDLIEHLSTIKERIQRLTGVIIGQPRKGNYLPTGIYALLEKKLFSVYGDTSDASEVEALRDDDPAIEGLARFGVWYLDDYFKLGLLQTDEREKEMSESERLEYKGKLFLDAEETLRRYGLRTVRDLKDASIFSRKSLGEWLAGK